MTDLSYRFSRHDAKPAGLFGWLRRTATALRNRRSAHLLLRMDAHQLADIGLTPGDVTSAFSGRLIDDPTAHLAELARERRYAKFLARGGRYL